MKTHREAGKLIILKQSCLRDLDGKCACETFKSWYEDPYHAPAMFLGDALVSGWFEGDLVKVLFRGRVALVGHWTIEDA